MFTDVANYFLRAVNQLLAFFYSLPVVGGSYGVAIILLTLTVMVLLMPLTLKATRSTIKMTQMQPKLRELQKKHKDDKQKLNQEMMALYQSEGINPVGGCLPMLAQMPVFLILFNVLRGLARREAERPYFALANRGKELAGYATTEGRTFDPANLDHTTQLYADLSQDTEMDFMGLFDLGRSASDVIGDSILSTIPYLILIVVVVGSSYYQQHQIQARRGDAKQEMTQQQQLQQQMLKILPLMSGVWSFAFPAGLVLYWATSNLFRIGQQSYITRSLYSGDAPGAELLRQQAADAEKADKDKADKDKADEDKTDTVVDDNDDGGADADAPSVAATNGSNGSKKKKTSSTNGSETTGGGGGGRNRAAEWQRMRDQRARSSQRTTTKPKSVEGSSRVTPKGTKPSNRTKKKR